MKKGKTWQILFKILKLKYDSKGSDNMLEITNDKLNNFFENNTVITVKEAEKIGIKRQILSNLCKKGILERVKQGVYQKSDTITDEFMKIQKNNFTVKIQY